MSIREWFKRLLDIFPEPEPGPEMITMKRSYWKDGTYHPGQRPDTPNPNWNWQLQSKGQDTKLENIAASILAAPRPRKNYPVRPSINRREPAQQREEQRQRTEDSTADFINSMAALSIAHTFSDPTPDPSPDPDPSDSFSGFGGGDSGGGGATSDW